jgi:hypothetical protein
MVDGRTMREGSTAESHSVIDAILRQALAVGDTCDQHLNKPASLTSWEASLTTVLIEQ